MIRIALALRLEFSEIDTAPPVMIEIISPSPEFSNFAKNALLELVLQHAPSRRALTLSPIRIPGTLPRFGSSRL
jgi:hypothetical protein